MTSTSHYDINSRRIKENIVKLERQSKIIEIITKNVIETQEDLVKKLIESGFDVTQATISRDIRELKIVKTVDNNGKNRYAIMQENEDHLNEKLIKVLKAGFINATLSEQFVIIKTSIGMGMGVATALDNMMIDGAIGTVAGDDTIFLATRSKEDARLCLSKIKKLVALGGV